MRTPPEVQSSHWFKVGSSNALASLFTHKCLVSSTFSFCIAAVEKKPQPLDQPLRACTRPNRCAYAPAHAVGPFQPFGIHPARQFMPCVFC